jgi:hypothetical protein
MLTAEARVLTERPSRYLVHLCRHFNHSVRHSPRTHHFDNAHPPVGAKAQVEWSDTDGSVDVGWGTCTLQATAGALMVRVEAADETALDRIQNLVATHLDRFGRRDRLVVTWQRADRTATTVRLQTDRRSRRRWPGPWAPDWVIPRSMDPSTGTSWWVKVLSPLRLPRSGRRHRSRDDVPGARR